MLDELHVYSTNDRHMVSILALYKSWGEMSDDADRGVRLDAASRAHRAVRSPLRSTGRCPRTGDSTSWSSWSRSSVGTGVEQFRGAPRVCPSPGSAARPTLPALPAPELDGAGCPAAPAIGRNRALPPGSPDPTRRRGPTRTETTTTDPSSACPFTRPCAHQGRPGPTLPNRGLPDSPACIGSRAREAGEAHVRSGRATRPPESADSRAGNWRLAGEVGPTGCAAGPRPGRVGRARWRCGARGRRRGTGPRCRARRPGRGRLPGYRGTGRARCRRGTPRVG